MAARESVRSDFLRASMARRQVSVSPLAEILRTFRTFQPGPHHPAKGNRGGALWRNLRGTNLLLAWVIPQILASNNFGAV